MNQRAKVIKLGNDEHENWQQRGQQGALTVEQVRPLIAYPRMYKVVMLNDDYTPMDFVVHVLELFFSMQREQATRVMLTVHTEGKAVCGVYSMDVAETKAEQVNLYSSQNEHPLLCSIEAVESEESDQGNRRSN